MPFFTTSTQPYKYRSVTTTDTSTSADNMLKCSGASFTQTIHTAVGNLGQVLVLQHAGTSLTQLYTLNTTSSQTIGGLASGVWILSTALESLTIMSDGANWIVLDHYAQTPWVSAGALTFTAITLNPTQVGNTKTVDRIMWRRNGSEAEFRIEWVQTAAGTNTAGTGDYLILLPLTVDTALITLYAVASTGLNAVVKASNALGLVVVQHNVVNVNGNVMLYDSTHIRLAGTYSSSASASNIMAVGSAATPMTTAAFSLAGSFKAPILNWQP